MPDGLKIPVMPNGNNVMSDWCKLSYAIGASVMPIGHKIFLCPMGLKFLLCQTGIRVMPEWGSLVMPNGYNTLMRDWHVGLLMPIPHKPVMPIGHGLSSSVPGLALFQKSKGYLIWHKFSKRVPDLAQIFKKGTGSGTNCKKGYRIWH
jgi:hypothetical protein